MLTLSGANFYGGATLVAAGTLKGGAENAFSVASATTIDAGATLDLGGFNETVTSLSSAGFGAAYVTNSGSSAATLTNLGASSTFGGVIRNGASATGLTQNGAGTLTLTGANTYTGATTVQAGTLALAGSGSITNSSGVSIAAGGALSISQTTGTTFNGAVVNGGAVTVDEAAAVFNGAVTNNGTFTTTASTVAFNGGFTDNGTFTSDPSTLTFTSLTVGANGAIQASAGDVIQISGNFVNESTQNSGWNISQATLEFVCPAGGCGSGADHVVDVSGSGANAAWGELVIDGGNAVTLDAAGAPGGVFYAGLVVGATVVDGVITNIDAGFGVVTHYDESATGNAYLGDGTYTLAGGGQLAPGASPVPEPRTWAMMVMGLLGLASLSGRGARGKECALAVAFDTFANPSREPAPWRRRHSVADGLRSRGACGERVATGTSSRGPRLLLSGSAAPTMIPLGARARFGRS